MLRSSAKTTWLYDGCPQIPHFLVKCKHGSSQSHGNYGDTRASAKLFADAVAEAAEPQTRNDNGHTPANVYPNWTGEESIQDAVLRMLVDKYKPLKDGSIRTADEKLKAAPPSLEPITQGSLAPTLGSLEASTPTPSSSDIHKPWLTTFRAPSHAASVRHMRFPPKPSSGTPTPGPSIRPDDTRLRIEQRERRKKAAYAGRLTNALESSLDYRLGKTMTNPGDPSRHHPNPTSVKGWMSLVEERIERARHEGYFRTVKGRGKPIVRENEESNPFIPREEFLMNRIVQRQGAAPPWVELQGGKPAVPLSLVDVVDVTKGPHLTELEAAITSFRATLRATWTRRAVRTLILERPLVFLHKLTLADVTGHMRDLEWEAREAGYHEEALREVNALVRKYNGVAPYSVRRTFLTKQAELDKMYEDSGSDILAEIQKRAEGAPPEIARLKTLDNEAYAGFARGGKENEVLEPWPWRFSLKVIWYRFIATFRDG